MKNILSEFYLLNEDEFKKLWNEGTIVFDSNILLNLYRYPHKTSKELLEIFNSFYERLWIPYQIALEYQKNRLSRIIEEEDKYAEIIEVIKSSPMEIVKDFENNKVKHKSRFVEDEIRDNVDKIFKNRIGVPYSQERLDEIYRIGKNRYEKKIPPGYKDIEKPEDERYGDLIIWLDIIEKVKKTKKPILFITDDNKEDWWQVIKGKKICPRYELLKEIKAETGLLLNFYIYPSERFMQYAKKYLKEDIKQDTIDEVQKFEIAEKRKEELLETLSTKAAITPKLMETLYKMSQAIGEAAIQSKFVGNLAKLSQSMEEYSIKATKSAELFQKIGEYLDRYNIIVGRNNNKKRENKK